MTSRERAEQVIIVLTGMPPDDSGVDPCALDSSAADVIVRALDTHAAEALEALDDVVWAVKYEREACAQHVEVRLCSAPLGITAPCRRCRACQVAAAIRTRGQG